MALAQTEIGPQAGPAQGVTLDDAVTGKEAGGLHRV